MNIYIPKINKTRELIILDQVSTSGFGGVHAAIINLAARTLGKRTWVTVVKPVNDEEAFLDSIRDPGTWHSHNIYRSRETDYLVAHGVSKFRVRVSNQLIHLRKAVISYIGNASNFTGQSPSIFVFKGDS